MANQTGDLDLEITAGGRELWESLPNPIASIVDLAFRDVDPQNLATTNRMLRDATERLNAQRRDAD